MDHSEVWAGQKTQGACSETWRAHPDSNWWIRNGPLSDNEFITACKLRTNTFPTRECLARTRTQGSVLCRRQILKVIRCIFSDIVDADEELSRFQNTVQRDNERPCTYLIRLYEKLLKISRAAISPIPKEIMNKLYRTFLSNSKKAYPLLGLTVQACFGMATTESSPHFADILQFVKKEEESCQVQASAKTASHNSAQNKEPTTEELVEAVISGYKI